MRLDYFRYRVRSRLSRVRTKLFFWRLRMLSRMRSGALSPVFEWGEAPRTWRGVTVLRWNADKKHRCPACHAFTVPDGPSSWGVYTCCRCEVSFTRWPFLVVLLPDRGIVCPEHGTEGHDR